MPAALLALMPKCLLCLTAYAGLGAALGLGGPEICGAPSGLTMSPWALAFGLSAAALCIIGFLVRHRAMTTPHRRRQIHDWTVR